MDPAEKLARTLVHYLSRLALSNGHPWTKQNTDDIFNAVYEFADALTPSATLTTYREARPDRAPYVSARATRPLRSEETRNR